MSRDVAKSVRRCDNLPERTRRRRLSAWKKSLYGVFFCLAVLFVVEILLKLVGTKTVLDTEDPSRGFSGLASVFVEDRVS